MSNETPPPVLPLPGAPSGQRYWRSLEEYADTPEFRAWAEREFPALSMELDRPDPTQGVGRRRFLQLMGASMALAGLTGLSGCRREEYKALPYKKKPPEIVPGVPLFYATSFVLAGRVTGILAETHEGRPTKLEGNPEHPNSLGALDGFGQASILELYDPDRSRQVWHKDQLARWESDFLPELDRLGAALRESGGEGLAVLSEAYASPALDLLREQFKATLGKASFHVHEPLEPGNPYAPGSWEARYELGQADVILALDADLLGLEDDGVRHKRGYASKRKVAKPGDTMNRLYVVEPHFTSTGSAADHRLRLKAGDVAGYAAALAKEILGGSAPPALASLNTSFKGDAKWITAVAKDLQAHRGRCLIATGRRQPEAVHVLARLLNESLGNTGKTVSYRKPAFEASSLAELAEKLKAGAVRTLLILGGNPAYNAPADLGFKDLLAKVETSIHLSLYRDETSRRCVWHVPAAHDLERWDLARSGDTLSPIQPMIDPLHGGKTALELLARLSGYAETEPYTLVRAAFRQLTGSVDFEKRWRLFLHLGVAEAPREAAPVPPLDLSKLQFAAPGSGGVELAFCADASVYDGRFANNGWLQEMPDPVTRLTWDNAACLSPATAAGLDVKTGDWLLLKAGGGEVKIPALVLPGSADGSINLPLGYGRKASGALGRHAGFNVYPLRSSGAAGFAAGEAAKAGGGYPLAVTQEHWSIETHEMIDGQLKERAIVREGTLAGFAEHPEFAQHMGLHAPRLNIHGTPKLDGDHQWGLAIDLSQCIGCNACAIACQAENNVPIVGKDEVIRGREMQWLRIDRYYQGADPLGEVGISHQPMMCQHCENAPCEPVCPVNATVHDHEGLNAMVYNRCIGTRYCSNNCPYKVRRFNFYDWNVDTLREGDRAFDGDIAPDPASGLSKPRLLQTELSELLRMQKNPDVTVRMRGVMEKCTFCVQRIQEARQEMKAEAGQTRPQKVPDGMVQSACQQACPLDAIVFGDISDPNSRVSKLKAQSRNYEVLGHLNVRPRTTYLARLRNLNPEMPESVYGMPEFHEPAHGPGGHGGHDHGAEPKHGGHEHG
ncbi:MAG: TAT-variant-translocated molybdopterin oxidoreductase [Planctomycetota bacterium]|nr:TAT-variant-translocated molybdopterin oxidoreductase [Planctomycetota bacterium]